MRARDGSNSRPGLIMSYHGTQKSRNQALLWYADHVCCLRGSGPLAVSTWDVVFCISSCHNIHELGQSPNGGGFEPVRGTPIRYMPKRGKSYPKGELTELRT